jgi:hypothetical protein
VLRPRREPEETQRFSGKNLSQRHWPITRLFGDHCAAPSTKSWCHVEAVVPIFIDRGACICAWIHRKAGGR